MSDGPQYPEYPGDQPDQGQPSDLPPPAQPPGYGQPPPPAWGQQPRAHEPTPPQPRDSQKAMWAMILGILGMVCCGLFAGIPAIVLGTQARREIDADPQAQQGRGMATAGFVLGIIATVGSVLYIAFLIVVFATNGFGEGLE